MTGSRLGPLRDIAPPANLPERGRGGAADGVARPEDPMIKSKSKTKVATRTAARKISKGRSRTRPSPASSKPAVRSDTKHARVITMLRAPAGTTIAAIMTATEWQQHSVRGFLAGVVRKKLDLNLVSELTDKGRIYRIKDGRASSGAVDRVKRVA
jgi:hypothetical protein